VEVEAADGAVFVANRPYPSIRQRPAFADEHSGRLDRRSRLQV
jgi:hypothetical protein